MTFPFDREYLEYFENKSIIHKIIFSAIHQARKNEIKQVVQDYVDEINIADIIADYTVDIEDYEYLQYQIQKYNKRMCHLMIHLTIPRID